MLPIYAALAIGASPADLKELQLQRARFEKQIVKPPEGFEGYCYTTKETLGPYVAESFFPLGCGTERYLIDNNYISYWKWADGKGSRLQWQVKLIKSSKNAKSVGTLAHYLLTRGQRIPKTSRISKDQWKQIYRDTPYAGYGSHPEYGEWAFVVLPNGKLTKSLRSPTQVFAITPDERKLLAARPLKK